ncbi:MAG: acyltransferase [Prevotella sp.]|nr:acyltransferase [Prevotella sp.]
MSKVGYIINNRAHYSRLVLGKFNAVIWYAINYFSAKWWGVNIGKCCHFIGKTHFNRIQGSFIQIGDNCTFNSSKTANLIGVYSPCMISTIEKNALIEIGKNCGFSGTVIGAALHIKLGNNVRCGANTLITDSDWHSDDYRAGKNKEVIIEDNVWLGYGVKVLKGVHIGENSLIGTNSVVTKDIPANVAAAGIPCRVIKQLKS